MRELEHLKEMLCEEIKRINSQGELTSTSLEIADTAVDIIKDIMEINEKEEKMNYGREMPYKNGYSGNYKSPYMEHSYNGYEDRNRGSWSNNYYDNGYSRQTATEQMIDKLEMMKRDASSSQEKSAIQRCIDELKNQ